MIRAVLFDFYSVWTPDKISYYLAVSQLVGPEIYKEMSDLVDQYYHGQVDIDQISDSFRVKLGHPDISVNQFKLSEKNISPQIVEFMRNLHEHFLKIGILANLGNQEYGLLHDFNEHNQLFEVIASPLSFKVSRPLLSKEVFAQALQTIGEPLDNCIYVSGNKDYLSFAELLGMKTIQFEGYKTLKTYIDNMVEQDMPK